MVRITGWSSTTRSSFRSSPSSPRSFRAAAMSIAEAGTTPAPEGLARACVNWPLTNFAHCRNTEYPGGHSMNEVKWRDARRELEVDVAIIGAGPAGLTAGYLLTKQGLSVAIIEKDPV